MHKPVYSENGIEIYHGDGAQILPTLADRSVDMIFTDPPYGHKNNNGDLIANREKALGVKPKKNETIDDAARPIENDGAEQAAAAFTMLMEQSKRLLAPGCCCCCCCCGGGPDPQFARWSLEMNAAMDFKQMVVWDKGPMGMGWHYRRSYEVVLVGQIPGAACRWFDESNKIENIIRHIPKIIPAKHEHPTTKPWRLAQHFISLHAQRGDFVLDPFMGGGSTLVAAKQLGCRAIGIELDERWVEIAIRELSQAVLFQ